MISLRGSSLLLAIFSIAVAPLVANAAPGDPTIPRYSDIMPLSKVKAGMVGHGLTVFRGTKIERFGVKIVGVVKKGSLVFPGHDLILVRLSGGPITERHANLIAGMSGSPVYINGKIIGAFSQGEPNSKEPLGGVTPIEDMLEAWDPKLPTSPLGALPDNRMRSVALSEPLMAGSRRIEKVVYNVPRTSALRSSGSTLVMHPCTTFVTVNGLPKSAYEKLKAVFEPYNIELAQGSGGGQKSGFKGTPLVPGSAFYMMLATGDFPMGAVGTVTYRKQNRILGFGHPFTGFGAIDAPLCSAWIYDIYPILSASRRDSSSYKIASPGPIVGSSTQDRNFAVSGVIGRKPHLIPVTADIRDLTTGRSRVFTTRTVTHPNFWSALVSAAVGSGIGEIRSTPGPAMARVTTVVDAEEIGKITRSNIVFDARGVDGAATADLDDMLGILTSNPFYPLTIKSAQVKVEIESGRKTAQVERIFLKEGRYEPGESAEVGVVLKPYKQPSITRTIKVPIPANTPSGRYVLQVKGGAVPAVSFGGLVFRPNSSNPEQAPPVSVRQMVDRFNEREKNNEMVARLVLTSTAVNVEGEKLSNLPPSLDSVMRSSKTSGVKLERDEVRVVQPTEWVVSGQQAISIAVQRKDTQETPGAASSSTGGQGSGSAGTPGGPPPFDNELADASDPSSTGDADALGLSAGAPLQKKKEQPGQPKQDGKGDQKSANSKPTEKSTAAAAAEAAAQAAQVVESKPTTTTAPQTPPAPSESGPTNEKPVGRVPLVWRQTTRADFAKGDAAGVSVSTQGDLALTRSLKRLQTTGEAFVWCLVPDGKGGLYAGTGTQGRVLHVDAAGKLDVVAKLPEVSVHSVIVAADGSLYAGTGPNGRVYQIQPGGKSDLALQTQEKYVLALARDSKGTIYAGTGGGAGRIYRVAPGAGGLFYKTAVEHVLCLATDREDNVYAGTSTGGLVYKVTPSGAGSVLYDAPEASITAIALNSHNDIYAVTAPKGVMYRIGQDGAAKTVFDKATGAFTALRAGGDDTIYAAAGSSVYSVGPGDAVAALDNRADVDILSLAVADNGTLYAGTGNVAEVYAAEPGAGARTGTYVSVVHDTKTTSRWGAIRWDAVLPTGAGIKIQTRSGNVAEPDSTWSPWQDPQSAPGGGRVASPPARFLQYRATLESASAPASPTLREVSVTYLPRNSAPKVTFQAPAGGERWAGKQSLKWEASDPDKDTLNYEVFYSSDNGAHWLPLPAGITATKTSPSGPSSTSTAVPDTTARPGTLESRIPLGSGPPSVEAVKAELDKHPDMPAELRDRILERARQVNAGTTGNASPQVAGGPAGGAAAPSSGPSRETSRSVDTRSLPDGRYVFKVVASDRLSNPADALTSEAVSESIVVCNSLPSLLVPAASAHLSGSKTITLEGTALQSMIPITAVQYRVDKGEWIAAIPVDGIFDGTLENFTLTTVALSSGKHEIEVKAFNAANATGTEKITVDVP